MPKHHVHIYKILALAEVDIEAENAEEARMKAAELAKNNGSELQYKKPDRDNLIVTFNEGE